MAALCGCKRESDVERANRDGILLVGNTAEPRALDLQLVTGVPENRIISSLYEGLIAEHPSDDIALEPGVATHWEHNEDMTEWVFHLRPDARWSDGVLLTAEDFIFSYHRMLSPGLAAAYAPMLHSIRNAEAYNRDQRGYILCGLDGDFPVAWETLKHANFSGDPAIDAGDLANRDFKRLSITDRKRLLAANGLDRLNAVQLRALRDDPSLFDWPETVPIEVRTMVIERLLDHVETDLFEKADIGLRAPNPHTLVVTLREPVPYLPSMARHSTWFPVPRHVILKFGKMTDRFTDWSKKGNLVGNGPFELKEWRYNHYIEVRRNPHYWDAAKVGLNGIRFIPIENPYTETRAFFAGQLHTTYSLPAELLGKVRASHPQYLRTEPYVGTIFLRLNVTRKGLDDPRVRRAFSLAINRAELCQYIYEGFSPAKTMTPKLGDYSAPDVLHHDLAKAKALLAEAGYPDGRGLPSYAILTSRPHPAADALQQTFRKLGVRVTIEQKDWGSYIAAQQSLNFDMAMAGWIGDYLDPTTFLDMWTRDNGNNNTGWHSMKYEAMLRQAAREPDHARRNATLARAESILMEELPILPVAWYSLIYLHRPEVLGWHPLVLNNHPWKSITLRP
ncbi:MAG: peptide ABC transporter substrate-binding protein [Luteolibacter sp.]|jgi:oligopeptide transport system substrate-binding protein|nr:peptide ABC transporter substrate-binding protein [Luteolibacter sp.]